MRPKDQSPPDLRRSRVAMRALSSVMAPKDGNSRAEKAEEPLPLSLSGGVSTGGGGDEGAAGRETTLKPKRDEPGVVVIE